MISIKTSFHTKKCPLTHFVWPKYKLEKDPLYQNWPQLLCLAFHLSLHYITSPTSNYVQKPSLDVRVFSSYYVGKSSYSTFQLNNCLVYYNALLNCNQFSPYLFRSNIQNRHPFRLRTLVSVIQKSVANIMEFLAIKANSESLLRL